MAHEWAKGLLCLVLLLGLVFAVLRIPEWGQETPPRESYGGLATGLFGPWVFAFELLSVLLLAALIGALYLSQKIPRGEEETR
jgi:NADH:ubiquinone oxidoreductase subunit 6 (subunit J)